MEFLIIRAPYRNGELQSLRATSCPSWFMLEGSTGAALRAESASKLVIWCLPAASAIPAGASRISPFQKRLSLTPVFHEMRARDMGPRYGPSATIRNHARQREENE